MEAINTTQQQQLTSSSPASAEELTAKAIHKRYEGLMMVRTKAINGKGAWYWPHFEPLLVHNSDNGLPKAVKLRCSLCDSVFSASNPSRTASEHLKRGSCPNFNVAKPITSVYPTGVISSSSPGDRCKKRGYRVGMTDHASSYCGELAVVKPHLVLSGGKEDLGALAMLEDSVRKLKSPKGLPGEVLCRSRADCAVDCLADWVYECFGGVSFSSIEHPKFRAFLQQVGMPVVSGRELVGGRLDAKYEEVKGESEARIRDAMFFQLASDGWKGRSDGGVGEESLVNMMVNLPNGTSLYRRAVFVSGDVPSKYAEDVLWETITGICGNAVQQCAGIVADRFKTKALRNLENRYQWMVNLSCQVQGFNNLIKDFSKELPLFSSAASNCFRIANFINSMDDVRHCFHKHQLQEYGCTRMIRVPRCEQRSLNFRPVQAMLEDILHSARALQLVILDESYKLIAVEDPMATNISEMVQDVGFWNELEAVNSLVKLVKEMTQVIETERPLVGQCLPLWDELRTKVKHWRSKFHILESQAERVIEKRFKKNYHPAWAAAFILDPVYLIRDTSGKYIPPFKCLTPEQEKDVDKLITRLVSREEAHVALMELMKWRTEGLDPVYAQAVQMKERDSVTGKMKIANPQSGRLVWETYLTEFKLLGRVAVRLIFLNATSRGFKCNWSFLRYINAHSDSRAHVNKAQKLIFIAAHLKLEQRDYSSDEDKDAELFTLTNGADNVLNEVFVEASSV